MKIYLHVTIFLSAVAVCQPINANSADACITAQGLANGIRRDMNLRRDEQANLAKLRDIVRQPLVDVVGFVAAKRQLLDLVSTRIELRPTDELVAPDDDATDGISLKVSLFLHHSLIVGMCVQCCRTSEGSAV